MDYEKAYKAVLKTATQWIKDGCTDKEKICLECVFPELRESEDERIRKWLIDYFGSIKATVWIHRDITCEQILAWLEKQKEQKPNIEICPHSIKSKSYKEQKPAEWSEEDEERIQSILFSVGYCKEEYPNKKDYSKDINWLKSLRPSWKPSEEQIRSLEYFISLWGDSDGQLKYVKIFDDVKSLCEQLKKL